MCGPRVKDRLEDFDQCERTFRHMLLIALCKPGVYLICITCLPERTSLACFPMTVFSHTFKKKLFTKGILTYPYTVYVFDSVH